MRSKPPTAEALALYAAILAGNAFRQGWNLTRDREKEFLLYYYNTRSLSKALQRARSSPPPRPRGRRLPRELLREWRALEERLFLPFR